MLNQTKSNLMANQSDKGSILNYTSLKFICEICSYSAPSIENLRTHLNTHNDNKESGPTKLNSLVTPRQVVSKTLNQSIPSAIINMPQSMTVFNLKEISTKVFSKLKNYQPTTISIANQSQAENNVYATTYKKQIDFLTSASVKAPTASLIYNSALQIDEIQKTNAESDSDKTATENSTKLDLNNNSLTQENLNEISTKQALSNLEEVTDSNGTVAPVLNTSVSSPIQRKTTRYNMSLISLPYHYCDCDKLYICNLCNCTYDSLRSIKAHLWKHSGHHELSYPIDDYKDKENSTSDSISNLTDTKINKELPGNLSQSVSQSDLFPETTPKEKLDLNSHSFCNSPKTCSSPVSPGSNSMQALQANSKNNNSGGICSALLEVIEKLHDEEESQIEEPINHTELDAKNAKDEHSVKQKKNLKRTAESKETSGKSKECKIETSVVNSLLDTDEFEEQGANDMTKADSAAKEPIKNKESNVQRSKTRGKQQKTKRTLNNLSRKQPLSDNNKTCKPQRLNEKRITSTVQLKQQTSVQDMTDAQTNISSYDQLDTTNSSLATVESCKSKKHDIFSLLSSLANNDGFEQYVCGLCAYVCYHLPSLKSHMWTHVKNSKFDYSVNTSIINAALDYENKLNRKLNSIRNNNMFIECSGSNKTDSSESNETERRFVSALDLINYPLTAQKLSNICISMSMVSFRCSRCGFETIDLSLLRLHKREHNTDPASLIE